MNRKQRRAAMKLGATGTHSRGKMNVHDEGDLRFAVTHTSSEVVVDFGKPVAWLGMEPDLAEKMANSILEHAAAIRKAAN